VHTAPYVRSTIPVAPSTEAPLCRPSRSHTGSAGTTRGQLLKNVSTALMLGALALGATGAVQATAQAGSGAAGGSASPAVCAPTDSPEKGIQGDVPPAAGVTCGLSLLSELPGGGSAGASGHCAYIRLPGTLPYTGSAIRAFDISNPLKPVQTDEVPAVGGSESMRVAKAGSRAIVVSGRGVYDVNKDCTKLVKKGEIPWPSISAQAMEYASATTTHEIAISHDAMRVYAGVGFGLADISDLEHPATWKVWNNTCELNRQSGFPMIGDCVNAPQGDYPRQYSHSSDDNAEGTRWYGANQNGDMVSQLEPPTMRIVDISDENHIKILGTLADVPGHSMSWWRAADGREFVLSANELAAGDTCATYPRNTSLMNAADGYVTEVTGDKPKHAATVTVAINRPENCAAAKASGSAAFYSEHVVYSKNGATFAMIAYEGAGLRIFDLRDAYHPKEVAYYNRSGTAGGYVHSAMFHYDEATGVLVASGKNALQLLVLEPQVIRALGLPTPTATAYPYLSGLGQATSAGAATTTGKTTTKSSTRAPKGTQQQAAMSVRGTLAATGAPGALLTGLGFMALVGAGALARRRTLTRPRS
jgi:hypothetical protein